MQSKLVVPLLILHREVDLLAPVAFFRDVNHLSIADWLLLECVGVLWTLFDRERLTAGARYIDETLDLDALSARKNACGYY